MVRTQLFFSFSFWRWRLSFHFSLVFLLLFWRNKSSQIQKTHAHVVRRSFSKDDDQSENLNRQRGGTRRRSLRYHRSNQRAHGREGRHSSDTTEVDFRREANARRENGEGLQHRRWKRDSHGFGAQRWRMCLEEDHI